MENSDLQHKVGRIYLFDYNNADNSLVELANARLDTAGVFDLKWCRTTALYGLPTLGQVDSLGRLVLYTLSNENILQQVASTTEFDMPDKYMSLSLDWNKKSEMSFKDDELVISHSNGHISQVKVLPTSLMCLHSWRAHDFEAWIAAYNYMDSNIVYTGGDDTLLKAWDSRYGFERPLFTSKKHTAGVCSIQCNPHIDYQFATGSYDEWAHLWDHRYMKQPIHSYQLGGGVWRIKWHPCLPHVFLTACMHGGVKIVDTQQHAITHSYSKHTSIAYGIDWNYASDTNMSGVSCSFYDHSFHYWQQQ